MIMAEAQKNYAQVLEQIKNLVGEQRIADVNSKIEELAAALKERAVGATGAKK
ncbi:MAG: hypothetical protein HY042_08565 [Spirochaetia bacterium]|nr:hypothetical protein [Spirochaetia bacterium]